jgi:hypothetical protein
MTVLWIHLCSLKRCYLVLAILDITSVVSCISVSVRVHDRDMSASAASAARATVKVDFKSEEQGAVWVASPVPASYATKNAKGEYFYQSGLAQPVPLWNPERSHMYSSPCTSAHCDYHSYFEVYKKVCAKYPGDAETEEGSNKHIRRMHLQRDPKFIVYEMVD